MPAIDPNSQAGSQLLIGSRILLAQDPAGATQVLAGALADLGVDLVVAVSGPEALALARQLQPDCILLDVGPAGGMSGFEVCAALAESLPAEAVPIILVTARSSRDDKLRALALGAFDFLEKPVERPDLIARIGNALRIRSLGKELSAAHREIEHLAKIDPATGVANRRQLSEVLENAGSVSDRYGRPLSVLLADIDHLRLVNDRLGLRAGDAALLRFAQVMEAASRDADTVGRFGDEEFLIVCPETEVGGAAVLADRIRAETEASVGDAAGDVTVTASFGCAGKLPGETSEDLLRRCAKALDTAKGSGRNRVCVARQDEIRPPPAHE